MGVVENVIVVLHNVFSSQKIVEAAKIVYGMGFKNFAVTKAQGSAAQIGVPEAHKLAIKRGMNFFYLQSIDDIAELFQPSKIYLFVAEGYAREKFNPEKIAEEAAKGVIAIVFGGSEPGLSKKELEKGIPIYIENLKEHTTIGMIAIALYLILKTDSAKN